MEEQPETPIEGSKEEDDADTLFSRRKILALANWASILAWIILVIYALLFAQRTVTDIRQNASNLAVNYQTFIFLISELPTLLLGLFYFIALQVFEEGIYLLLDIFDKGKPE